jgi:hypothetical protein
VKILAHVHGYPPGHNAGAEHALRGLLVWLVGRGHQVDVVCPSRAVPGDWDGVQVTVGPPASTLAAKYRAADVVITHLDLTRQAMDLCRATGRPLAHYVHNGAQLAHHQVKPSPLTLAIYNSQWLLDAAAWEGAAVVCHPPVWGDAYRVDASRGTDATLLNINANKGAATLWALAARCPGRSFLAVKGAYETQSVPTPRPRNVTVWDTQVDVRLVYARTRVVLMPSEYESWGRVAMEAAASGIPTICHPTPGLRECLGTAGIYVDRNDIDGYVKALARLDKPRSYAAASRKARERFERYARELPGELEATEAALATLAAAAEAERARKHLRPTVQVATIPEAAYFPGAQFCYVARRPFRYWAWTYGPGDVVQGLPPRIATMLLRRGVIEPFGEATGGQP